MLRRAANYESLRAAFRWDVPARFNIAEAATSAWARREPGRVAVRHRRSSGLVDDWTYGALDAASNRLANALAAHGIGRGDRVALLLPQGPETVVAHLAIYKLGAVAVPLALLFGVEAIAWRLGDSGAKAVIAAASALPRVAEARLRAPDLRLVIRVGPADDDTPAGTIAYHDLLAAGSDSFRPVDTSADEPAMMIYTSGTTGPPKGALHAHRVLLGHLPGVEMPHEFLPQPGDLLWTPADWAWAGGLLNVLLPGLLLGVPVVAARFDKFDPDLAYRVMADLGVRNTFLPPTALRLLRAAPSPAGRYDLRLRSVGSGGEALGRDTFEWATATLGVPINEFYGQTECNLVLASCAGIGVSRPGAIGKPVPGHEVAILGEDGAVLPPGSQGQIAVRRPDPVMFLGYWGRPDATRDKFLGDWMLTGDQGIADADGYVHFVGRDDDVITSAGYRIGPGEIEDCLASHPAVALAAVVGKPDPVRTEIVTAFVKLAAGFTPSDALAAEIREHVRTRLSAHEYPRAVTFVDEIPLTTTGKVIRRHFREQVRGGGPE